MKSSSVIKNFLYNSFYQVLTLIVPLLTTPYISRVLHPEGVGIYSYAYSIAFYFGMIAILGLNNYGNRSIASVREDKLLMSKTFYEILFMQLLTGTVAIILYFLFIIIVKGSDIVSSILSLYVVSETINITWFFAGIEEFKSISIRNTIVKILSVIAIFVFVKTQNDLMKYVIIMAMGFLVSQLIIWPFVFSKVKYVKPSFRNIVRHYKPNLILFIPVVAVSLYRIMDKVMLGAMTDMDQVGLYESSDKIIQLPIALVASLGTVMLPKVTNLISKGELLKSMAYIRSSFSFAAFFSTSLCFGIMGISNNFIPLFYGSGFELCKILYLILLPSCVFTALANVIRTQYIIPFGKDYLFVISVSAGAITNLVINSILIPRYAAIGAAIGTIVAEFIVWVVQIIGVKNELPLKLLLVDTLPFYTSGLVMFFILYSIPKLAHFNDFYMAIFKFFIGILLYLSMLIVQIIALKKIGHSYGFDMIKKIILRISDRFKTIRGNIKQ